MKKQLLGLFLTILSAALLTGCAFGSAQSRLDSVFESLLANSTFHVVADLTETSTTAGQGEQKAHFDGVVDLSDKNSIKAEGTLTTSGATVEPAMTAHFILTDKTYIQFQNLNYPGSPFTITPAIQSTYYVVDDSTLGDLLPGGAALGGTSTLSKDQKQQIQDAIKKAKPLTLVEKKGGEKIGKKYTSHYTAKLNSAELLQLAITIKNIEGKPLDATAQQQLQKQLDEAAATPLDIWLGKFDGRPVKVQFAMTSNDTKSSGTVTVDQFNDKVSIKTPSDAKPFGELFNNLGTDLNQTTTPAVDLPNSADQATLEQLQQELEKLTQ